MGHDIAGTAETSGSVRPNNISGRVKRLRYEVRASLQQRPASQDNQAQTDADWIVLRLRIRLSPDQLHTCQSAADKASLSIEAWTARVLDHAARHQLEATGTRQPDQ